MKYVNENITEVYNYVNHSLTFVEAKNGALVALSSAVVIGIASLWDKLPSHPLCLSLIFLPAVLSLFLSLASYYPCRKKKSKDSIKELKTEDINLFRCESIKMMPISQLYELFKPGLETGLSLIDEQKVKYIKNTSVTVGRKYRLFRAALYCFSLYGLYLLLLLICIIILQRF